ncbi:hypothetical protein [Rossellomorea sp. NPDC077527]|uniref:hypothetical protein n=1 Tax=Rossellomorea sp. NPDC077527 TaxID=3364510 RepID=UPI0037C73F11
MKNDQYDDIEKHFLNKMDEFQQEKHRKETIRKDQPHHSFSLFNLNQKHAPSTETNVNNEEDCPTDSTLTKEFQEGILSQPTFFPPPKVMDMEIIQDGKTIDEELKEMVNQGEGIEEENLLSNHFREDLHDERNKVELSASGHSEVNELSSGEEDKGKEPISIRKEIFMILDEEPGEESAGGLSSKISTSKITKDKNGEVDSLKMKENDKKEDEHTNEQNVISEDHSHTSREEGCINSYLDYDHKANHPSSFTHFLETEYCESENKSNEFNESISSLTSVLKKISTAMMKNDPKYPEECEQDRSELTALKKHFENELFSPEPHTDEAIATYPFDFHFLTVKIPIVLSTLKIELTIFENLDLPFPIEHIQTIRWSIQSLKTYIPSPASIVFVKGTLIAAIDYVNPGETSSVHSIKIPIEWNHTCTPRWIVQPKIPICVHREYTFLTKNNQRMTTHHESHDSFCDSIHHSLQDFKFISQEEHQKDEVNSTLKVQGFLALSLHLTQEQFVQLNVNEVL